MLTTALVKMMGELNIDTLQGRKVYLVEDTVDTGMTLATLLPMIQDFGKLTSAKVVNTSQNNNNNGQDVTTLFCEIRDKLHQHNAILVQHELYDFLHQVVNATIL
jgi:hypoxanthine phosphoribosyltransferase